MAKDDKNEITPENGEEKPKKNHKIFLIFLLFTGLMVGGLGSYLFFNYKQKKLDAAEKATQEAKEAFKNDTRENEQVLTREELDMKKFVLFEGIAVPIYNSRGKYIGNYKVNVKVLTVNDAHNVKVKNVRYQLRHAMLTRIAQGDMLQDRSTNIDYNKLAKALTKVSEEVVGEEFIYRVVVEGAVRINH